MWSTVVTSQKTPAICFDAKMSFWTQKCVTRTLSTSTIALVKLLSYFFMNSSCASRFPLVMWNANDIHFDAELRVKIYTKLNCWINSKLNQQQITQQSSMSNSNLRESEEAISREIRIKFLWDFVASRCGLKWIILILDTELFYHNEHRGEVRFAPWGEVPRVEQIHRQSSHYSCQNYKPEPFR